MLIFMNQNNLLNEVPNLSTLQSFVLTCTTAPVERSFLTLNSLKTYTSNNVTKEINQIIFFS